VNSLYRRRSSSAVINGAVVIASNVATSNNPLCISTPCGGGGAVVYEDSNLSVVGDSILSSNRCMICMPDSFSLSGVFTPNRRRCPFYRIQE
jgi:hypothetical protein